MFLFSSERGGSESLKPFAVFISYTLTDIHLAADVTTNGVHYTQSGSVVGLVGQSFADDCKATKQNNSAHLGYNTHKMLPYDSCSTEAFYVFFAFEEVAPICITCIGYNCNL